jgi:hypothetical protein
MNRPPKDRSRSRFAHQFPQTLERGPGTGAGEIAAGLSPVPADEQAAEGQATDEQVTDGQAAKQLQVHSRRE